MSLWLSFDVLFLTCCALYTSAYVLSQGVGPCSNSICRCRYCTCDAAARAVFLHAAFSNKIVFFLGDSTMRGDAQALRHSLEQQPLVSTMSINRTCMADCPFDQPAKRLRWESKVYPYPKTKLIDGWTTFNDLHRKKALFPSYWSDSFVFIRKTNTTIVILFSTVPEVLQEKIDGMLNGTFSSLPDVVIMNVGLWSMQANHSRLVNALLEKRGFPGRVSIPDFNITHFVWTLMGVIHYLDTKLISFNTTYRPFVAYREMYWMDNGRKDAFHLAANDATRMLNKALHEQWNQRSPKVVGWLPLHSLSALPCCGYYNPAHPGQPCSVFLNMITSQFVISHYEKSSHFGSSM